MGDAFNSLVGPGVVPVVLGVYFRRVRNILLGGFALIVLKTLEPF